MKEDERTREQLLQELESQRRLVSLLEASIASGRQVEEEISQSEKRFRSVAESANDAIVCADGEGNIVFWNQGAQAIFGYEENEVVGQPLTMLMPSQYKDLHKKGLARGHRQSDHSRTG